MTNQTSPLVAKVTAPRGVDRELARLVRRQHGLVTTAQLVGELGLTSGAITKRVRAGRLHRIHRGVYALGHASLSHEARWHAAVLAAGTDAALAGLSAARSWELLRPGLDRLDPDGIDVVTSSRRRVRPSGVRVHESRSLRAVDVTRRLGMAITSVTRTMLDLGDVLTCFQLANVMHEAAFRSRLRLRSLDAIIDRSRGRSATTVLRRALELHRGGSAGSRSNLEDRALDRIERSGLPVPLVNTHIDVGGPPIEVDLCWPDRRLCIEIDGPGHLRSASRREDAARDRRLRTAGYQVIRLDAADVRSIGQAIVSR